MGQKKIGVLPAESPRLNERNQAFFNKNERKMKGQLHYLYDNYYD